MIWLIVILVVVALLVVALIALYNRFVRLRNRVDNAWAQIEVQLKRRWDLIPNLVETVKGYAAHERGTFEAVTEARANAQRAQRPGRDGGGRRDPRPGARPAVRGRRGVPGAPGRRELPPAADRARRDREPDRRVAPGLQRHGAHVQQRDPDVPRRARSPGRSGSRSASSSRGRDAARGAAGRVLAGAAGARLPPHRPPPRPPSPARVAHPVARPGVARARGDVVAALSLAGVAQAQTYDARRERRPGRRPARTAPSRSRRRSRSRSPARSRTASATSRSARASGSTRSACSEKGSPFRPGASTELEPGGPPGTFGVDDLGGRERDRLALQSDGFQERTFAIHYRLRGLAVAYDDVVDVNLKVWGDEWEQRLGRLTATMRGPGEVVRAWGHPVWVRGDVTLAGPERSPARARRLRRAVRRAARAVSAHGVHLDGRHAGRARATGCRRSSPRRLRTRPSYESDKERIDDAIEHPWRTAAPAARRSGRSPRS